MMEQDLLSQLEDIILPSTVDTWPVAWGWWLVGTLVLLLILIISLMLMRRHRFYAVKRAALKAALKISNVSEANQLLKVTCIHYFGREQVAALHGQAWCEFLLTQLTPTQQDAQRAALQHMLADLYRANATSDPAELVTTVTLWLKNARWTTHA